MQEVVLLEVAQEAALWVPVMVLVVVVTGEQEERDPVQEPPVAVPTILPLTQL
jgi:hypothetical protein